MKKYIFILFLLTYFISVGVFANAEIEENTLLSESSVASLTDAVVFKQEKHTPSNSQMMIKAFSGMVVIVLFILCLAWLAKRLNIQNLTGHKNMKVLEVLPLGTREKVIVVEVYGEHVLMGVAPGNVNYIKTLDPVTISRTEEKFEDNAIHSSWNNTNKGVDFAKKLNEFLSQGQ